jgi:hypothetical protein
MAIWTKNADLEEVARAEPEVGLWEVGGSSYQNYVVCAQLLASENQLSNQSIARPVPVAISALALSRVPNLIPPGGQLPSSSACGHYLATRSPHVLSGAR